MAWHERPVEEVLTELDSEADGLAAAEAERRLREHGPNEIVKGAEISPLAILADQFRDFLIYLLLLAAGLSLAVGLLPGAEPQTTDAVLILAILLGNGLFGFVQDYRAERSMQALQEMSTPSATVVRDGEAHTVPATDLVVGDVVVIGQGDRIPADVRLLETHAFETQEAALTGESATVPKQPDPVAVDTPLAERSCMAFMNTNAVKGRARAVVVATGMDTRIGAIAEAIQQAEDRDTPFQREIDQLGKQLGYAALGLIVVVALVQLLATEAAPIRVLLVAVTLAVAAVPEGLPAVVTLTLALGSRQMAERNALVRRLPVVESLGSIDVILTDKTGTLTENQMTVERIWRSGKLYEVTGTGLDPDGEFRLDGEPVGPSAVQPVLECGLECNDAELGRDEAIGDPTEIALLVSAAKAGLERHGERLHEVPFSSERKRMSVVVPGDDGAVVFMKGAAEAVLERCDRILDPDGDPRALDDELRQEVLEANRQLARDAYRVLAFARRQLDHPDAPEEEIESGMLFLGLQAMIDPPRSEVAGAVADCRQAGIRVVMVTGDNPETAVAVAREIGFDVDEVRTGAEIEELSDQELRRLVREVDVYARATPQHKVRLLQALQDLGHRVAMTGDGVNDAPALRQADIGVAMGQRGTDVARQAADMVLQDDNFVSIRDAVAQGRRIFDNIRKFVNFLLSANVAEVLAVFFGVLVGSAFFPERFAAHAEGLILTPVMLLWINLVTDGLPALALGADPGAGDVLARPPRAEGEPVIDRRVLASVLGVGTVATTIGLLLFFHELGRGGELVMAQTLLFTFLVLMEMLVIQVIRRRFGQSLLTNPWLIAAVASSIGLQLLVLYTPAASWFGLARLGPEQWLRIGAVLVAFQVIMVILRRFFDRVADAGGTPA